MTDTKTRILDADQIQKRINRIAYEIYENNWDEKSIVMVGIAKRGSELAKRVADKVHDISDIKVVLGEISMNKSNPLESEVELSLDKKDLKNKSIVLVDDVLNSGKTLIYAAKILLRQPIKSMSTVVLVDRKHRRFPIKADFVGLTLSTTLQEHINVDLKKGNEAVYLE